MVALSKNRLIFPEKVQLALAPMAGITDKPFRQLCRSFGADWAVGEMITDNPSLQHTRKTLNRRNRDGEEGVIVAQIVGSNPQQLADAARYNVDCGAQVIDINMGCPVKKVCNVLSGSALLQNEALVADILSSVTHAVDVPVTLKTRLGWDSSKKNILLIAKMAEEAGIAALAIHGRTREQMYSGKAQYDLIAEVRKQISLPVWANGDIDSPEKAGDVLKQTGSHGLMIGRAAQGQPWLFADIRHYLDTGVIPPPRNFQAASEMVLAHIAAIHDFYGEQVGVRMARKHIIWYLLRLPEGVHLRKSLMEITTPHHQLDELHRFLESASEYHTYWPRAY